MPSLEDLRPAKNEAKKWNKLLTAAKRIFARQKQGCKNANAAADAALNDNDIPRGPKRAELYSRILSHLGTGGGKETAARRKQSSFSFTA